MKALVKIAPIIVILACAASLFFSFKLNGLKTGLQNDKTDLTAKLGNAESKLTQTQKTLDETKTELKQSKDATAEAQAQLDAANVKLTQKTREADDLTAKAAKLVDDLKTANDDKAKAEQVVQKIQQSLKDAGVQDIGDIDAVRKKIEVLGEENQVLSKKLKATETENTQLTTELKAAKTTPEGLRGKVALAKSMWNFVILDVGAQDKVQPQTTFIVYRDSQLVGKARVTTVYPNSCVAELEPQFTTIPPRAGDIVIHGKM